MEIITKRGIDMRVLIIGATGGIGKALIDIFYRNNWEILAVGRNQDILKELKKKYKEKLNIYSLDLENEKNINKFFKEIEEQDINLLINGAGIGELGHFEDISYENEKKMIDINIIALIKFTKYFYNKIDGIINISSTAGFQYGGPLMTGYYATKSFVNSFTFGLMGEGGKTRMMLLCPGPTLTNFKGVNKNFKGIAKFYMTTPEEVAEKCYSDYLRKKRISIPGKINKILYFFNKIIPIISQLKMIKKIQEKKIKK